MKRKPISKKLRFEVLKRDAFTCQYCGEKAPDVILHVDHIKSVVTGGDGEIINLITACSTCNLGKGPHNLSDKSAVNKQRKQLDDINERRNQLELMVKWRNEIASIKNDELEAIIEAIPMETNSTLFKKILDMTIKRLGYKEEVGQTLDGVESFIVGQRYNAVIHSGIRSQIRQVGKLVRKDGILIRTSQVLRATFNKVKNKWLINIEVGGMYARN